MTDLPEISGKDKAIMTAGIGGATAAGAVIGSIVPGVGTLIGAGVGEFINIPRRRAQPSDRRDMLLKYQYRISCLMTAIRY